MIVTLSGITGTGKSFFKDAISKELGFKNLAIVTTRNKRKNEVDGIDKEFVNDVASIIHVFFCSLYCLKRYI